MMKILVIAVLALMLPGLLGYALAAPVITTSPVAFVTDGVDGFEELEGPKGVTAVAIGSSTYALVASYSDNGVQIINITDPFRPVPLAAVTDGVDGFEELKGARDIATATIGSSTYAIVTASADHGIQIINITDPSNPVPTSHISSIPDARLNDPREVTTVTIGSSTYALVAADGSGVHIIDITDPSNPVSVASVQDGINGFDALGNSRGIITTAIGSSTYAIVAAFEGAVQIMDITDPSEPTPVGSVHDSQDTALRGAIAVTTFTSGSSTYALVVAQTDDSVQIIDITDLSNPDPVAFVQHGVAGFDALRYPESITTVTFGSSTYALVVAFIDGIQIIDVTDPSNPTPAASVYSSDTRFGDFRLPEDLAVIEVDSRTYALIASNRGNSVQIIDVDLTSGPAVTSAALNEETGILEITFLDTVDVTPASTVDLSGLTIRDSGQSVSLAGAALRTEADSAVISIELTEIQNRLVASMASPRLDISSSAVTDTLDNPIELSLGNVVTVSDDVAPEIVSVIMDMPTGILEITFSDVIDVTPASMVYTEDMTIRDSGQSISLAGAALRTEADSAVISIELTEGQRRSITAPVSPLLDVIYYGVIDTAGNPIELSSDNAITVKNTNETEPLAFQSAVYTAGDGQLAITFSNPLNGTVHLDRLHVRDAGRSSGGIAMTGASGQSVSGDILIITLVASQVTAINNLTIPQLDVDRGAVFDLAGISIADTPDQPVILINTPPTVDAGQNRAVNEGDAVILSGTASDPEGDHLTYLWSHDSALPITVSNATSQLTTFTAPAVDSDVTVTFVLSVSDGTNTDVTDQVTITIQDVPTNNPPTVDAGQDRTVNEGDTLTLNGTAFDADGDALTYLWSHDSDSEIILDSPSSTSVSFTVPQVTSNATITFTMTVTDEHNATGSDAVVIAILDVPADDLPDTVDNLPQKNTVVWNAPEQHGPRDISRITLSSAAPGTIHATWDVPGEAPANYRVSWAKTGESYLPLTNSAGNTFPSVPSQTITGLEEGGEYRVRVLAGYGDTAGDWSGDVIITVARSTANPLAIRAVPDQTVSEMSILEFTVTVDGGGRPAGTLVYGLDGAPAGALIDPTTGEFEWTPAENQDGHHTIVITASDSGNRTATSHVNVVVGEVNMDPVLDKIPDLTADDLSVVTFILNATDDDRHPGVGAETVVGNLRIPWSIDWTPDGTALFTERDGNLRVIYDGVLESEPLLSIDVGDVEGGLLGLAVDPDFEENQYIYLYYTYTENSAPINKVVRYQFSNGTVTEDLVLLDGIPGAQYHDGGRIQFGPDEKLYITTGDAGNPSLAQDSDSLAGKILRINRDGTVPAGNPFANSTVWSIGHRNPQGIDWDEYGNLVASEHGPSGGIRGSAHDEINLIVPGANYGWPDIIGGDSAEGLQTPILHTGRETWAPSGAEFYDGDKIAGWTGKYFVAALRGAHLHMIDIDPQTHTVLSHEKLFQDEFGRLRDVQTGPDGFLYVLTSNRDGRGTPEPIDDRILRIVPMFEPGSERPANSLTYGLDGVSKGASVNQITGVFTWETPNVQEDSVFTFNVTVSDGAGGTAVQTVTIRVDDTHAELPRDPRDIGVVTLNSTVPGIVDISWDAPDQTPANYRVSWAKAGEPYLTSTNPAGNAFPTVPFHTITGLEEGGEYRIKVRASYSGTSGDWSDEVTATVAESPVVPNTPATGMPIITGTVQVGHTLTADISGIADADGITGVSFNYLWISDNGTAETEIGGGGGGDGVAASRHVLTADDLGDTIKVRVAFTDDAGHAESLTSAATHAVAPAYTVPGVPANLLVSQGNSGGILKVSWQAPASNGGSNLTGYTVQWKTASDSWAIPADIAEATLTGTAHTITGLTDGTSYAVRVLATNVIGDGKPTSEETATPQAPVPLRDPRDIGVVTLNSTVPGIIDISWDAPDQTPANYRVSWAKAGEPYLTWTNPAGNAFPTVPFHTITGLEEGGEYRIKVRASYSGTSGDWSDEVTATVAESPVVPNTPATGMPIITGTVQVGHTLTADISGIADADGITGVSFNYLWISDNGTAETEIGGGGGGDGVAASRHVLTADDLGDTIKVRVAFTDDAGHAESLTSAATHAVAPAYTVPGVPANLLVSQGDSGGILKVSWQAPASNGGSNLTGYTVQWKTASDSWAIPADIAEATLTGTAHTITGLTDGTSYAVRVLATNVIGDGKPTSEETATPQAPVPLRDPRDIGVVTLNSTVPGIIDISWDAPDQTPANYRVSWAKAGEPYLTWTNPAGNAFPTVPFHTITGLEEGGEYRIKVRASYSGTSGDWSDEVTATVAESPVVPNTPATGMPIITGTVQVGHTLTADISGIADADGITGVSFNYLWISDNGTAETEIGGGGGGDGVAASRHVLTADDLGDTIKVRVAFTDDAGHAESLTSAATHAVAPAYTVPGVPANLLVSQGDSGGILKVSWQAPASNGGSNLTGYTVQWKTASDSWAIPADITEATLTGTAHTITGLTDGTSYAVRVLATNVIGDGKPTSEETATPQAPVPLRDPRDIGVVTLNSTVPGIIDISWDAPDQTPANYRVSWAKAGEPYLTWTNPAGNAFPTVPFHTITGLEEGGEYRIKVRASYSGTSGDWSDEVTATVAESPVVPNTPATGMPIITGTVQVGHTLTADISGIADADGITGVSFNYLWISDNGTAETEIGGGGGGDGVAASRHVLTADDLGDTIKVRVAFTDDAGHAESLTSAATHAVAPAYTVPGVPANLLVSQGDSGGILKVSWQAPASNGGSNLTGYTVQWKTASDSWAIPADIAEATLTGTAHTITGLTDGTSYAVRVLATNVIGDGKPTSEETATPQAPVPLRDPRDIGVVTLNSTVPGIVTVSWDAPDQTPANYRVSWAKAGEPYLARTDSAGNAFPTVPFHTITGLEEGGEYRVKVRAIYNGTSGDWSDEVTATVAKTFHPFITTWQTTVAGESITIPVGGATGIYTIDWGDGNVNYGVSGDQIHTYDDAGTYTVRISGDFARIYLNGQQPNADKLQSIEQWGSVRWESMRSAFQGTSSMAYRATDTPDLSDVISMRYMFRSAASFNADLSAWGVSSVTDMRGMFYNAASFNADLSAWDVSSVTDMREMFYNAVSFNGDLSAWDVSSVTDMSHMFRNAASFNADLSAWDVSSVTDMSHMFSSAASFNADLSAWGVLSVTDMSHMFRNAASFNADLSAWDVSSVTDMSHMFRSAASFNADLSAWDVSSVTDMRGMFYNVASFNGDLSAWDVSSVTDMRGMFMGTTSFNADLSAWDVSSVTDTSYMFRNAASFNADLSAWDVSSVTAMSGMFRNTASFNADLSAWNVSRVTDMNAMFDDTRIFDQNLGMWYIVLDNTVIEGGNSTGTIGTIAAQNSFLDGQNPIYGIEPGGDSDHFEIDGTALKLRTTAQNSLAGGSYTITITSTGEFGTGNSRTYEIVVADA